MNIKIDEMNSLMPTYNRFPISLVKGKGSFVWDENGNEYLDFTSGIATCNLGHAPDQVKMALIQQLENLWHCSNLYKIDSQEKLATLLTRNSSFDQVFFCNSGAEANEAAIKLARIYTTSRRETNNVDIVTFKQSFHGRTLATLTASGQEKIQKGFTPLMPGFSYLPYNDLESLIELIQIKPSAVMLELVQGEGGVIPAERQWIDKLVSICHDENILIIVDEVQTGIGRTGTLFAYEQYGFEPDIMTLAKGLGSGFPIGAMLAKKEVAASFTPGTHGSTFGGNPLATTAGLTTLDHLLTTSIIENSQDLSQYLVSKLMELQAEITDIQEIRGKGLLIGIVMERDVSEVIKLAINEKLLILSAGTNVIRILPPLTVTKDEIDLFIKKLTNVLMKKGEI